MIIGLYQIVEYIQFSWLCCHWYPAHIMNLIFQLIVVVYLFQSVNTIFVNSSLVLQRILCQNFCNPALIILDSSVQFELNAGNLCVVNTSCSSFVAISSNSNITNAVITCSTDNNAKTGIAFVNAHIVLWKITIRNCGTYLKALPETVLNIFNSSLVHYRQSYAAALILVNCVVGITDSSFSSSFGFGLVGINLQANAFQAIAQNSDSNMNIGSGILLHYLDSDDLIQNYNRTIHIESLFSDHFFSLYNCNEDGNKYFSFASALTVIFAQTTFEVQMWIRNSRFHRIEGRFGAVGIYQYNLQSSIYFLNTIFLSNVVYLQCAHHSIGASITYILDDHTNNSKTKLADAFSIFPLRVSGCTFDNSHVQVLTDARSIYIWVGTSNRKSPLVKILIRETVCVQIHGTKLSGCLYIKAESVSSTIILEDISVIDNIIGTESPDDWFNANGILMFDSVSSVQIIGSANFAENYGSVIKSVDSTLILKGWISFAHNHAGYGGAIHISGKSFIYFVFASKVNFKNNSAVIFGGAIYSNTVSDYKCPFCFDSLIKYRLTSSFIGNKAGLSGKDIYSTTLYNCHICNSSEDISNPSHTLSVLSHFFSLPAHDANSSLLSISTKPNTLHWLNLNIDNSKIYPGQTIEIHLAALDEVGRSVYSPVNLHVNCFDMHSTSHCDKIWIVFVQKEQLLQENQNFTAVRATVHTSDTNDDKPVMAGIGCSILGVNQIQSVQFFLHPCPLGFHLNTMLGVCQCSSQVKKLSHMKVLDKYPDPQMICSIINQQFYTTIVETWAGIIENKNKQKSFAVSYYCPSGNCNVRNPYNSYFTNETGLYRTTDTTLDSPSYIPICTEHREGPLCGKCMKGYSIALNSRKCKLCHNRYLPLNIVAFLVYGLLLILVMFTFTLTLSSGALNGIIFYANLSNIGIIDLMSLFTHGDKSLLICIKIADTFLEILNANPIFPTCLFEGMNELWKTVIKLLFQFYLWSIVLMLMWISQYSVWLTRQLGNSSIKVLVTIFHISACRMLITLIDVFTWTKIYTENDEPAPQKVWVFDGSVQFFQNKHLILSVSTLFIVAPLLLFYCTVLLFPRQFYRCGLGNRYCRPLIEAVHAPYREGKEYWFTLRIAILVAFYAVYVSYRGINYYFIYLITLPILTFLIIGQVYSQPFRSKLINILDIVAMANFVLLEIITWYYLMHGKISTIAIQCVISTFVNLFLLCVIMLHRIAAMLNRFHMVKRCVVHSNVAVKYILFKWRNRNRTPVDQEISSAADSFYQPCTDYREPLLN